MLSGIHVFQFHRCESENVSIANAKFEVEYGLCKANSPCLEAAQESDIRPISSDEIRG
jgi:hypothetical protein